MDNADIVLDNIISRRSVRQFSNDKITKEDQEKILLAANSAPSAGDLQSRRFILVSECSDLDFIRHYIFAKRKLKEDNYFKNTPLMIIVVSESAKCRRRYKRGAHYAMVGASLSGQNMMLLAHAIGISSCWIGQVREKQLSKKFDITENEKLVGIIAFGYAEKTK